MPFTLRHPLFVRTTLALAVAATFGSAHAQQAVPPDPATSTPEDGLQTVVVTAQKRQEKLQEVPIAVTAYDSAALTKTGSTDMRDIALRTPGFTMTQFNIGEPSYSMRGISSSSDSAAAESSVAIFVDDVFIGRPAGANFSFLDLERIEVLRGPQGTLFGRNTSGGALSVTTAAPSRKPSTKFHVSYGNYSAKDLGVVFNRPISETASVKLAVGYREHDGYSSNLVTGAGLDGGKNTSVRLQVRINVSPDTSVLLSGDAAADRGTGLARVPFPVFSTAGPNAAIPSLYPAGTDLRRAYSDPASFQNRDVHGVSARIEHDTSIGALTSISAHRVTKLAQYEDLSGLPPPWVLVNQDRINESAKQFSQELRFASLPGTDLKWVTGLYYFKESVERDESFFTRYTVLPIAGGNVRFDQLVDNKSAAAFGQVDLPLAPRLNLSVGLRHTRDTKVADQAATNLDPSDATPGIPLFPGKPYHVVASKTWDANTGKVGLDYRIDRDKMVYVSVARGYKSGMFPSQNNSLQTVGVALEPEKVMNVEVGAKTEWFNKKLRVNATAYAMDYKDLQQYGLSPQLVLVTYSLDAKSKGAELEVLAAPVPWLTLGGNFAYSNTRVERGSFLSTSLVGNELGKAPPRTYGLSAEATRSLASGKLSARLEYAHKSSYFNETTNEKVGRIEAYGLLDARLTYVQAGGNLEVSLWGKNLNNTLYQQHIIAFQGNGFSTFGAPRTIGASLTWKLPN